LLHQVHGLRAGSARTTARDFYGRYEDKDGSRPLFFIDRGIGVGIVAMITRTLENHDDIASRGNVVTRSKHGVKSWTTTAPFSALDFQSLESLR
jgi:hypothetical protein